MWRVERLATNKWLGAIKTRKDFAAPHEHNATGAFTCPR
jgi:hypothetical protein